MFSNMKLLVSYQLSSALSRFFYQLFKAIIDVFCGNTPKSFLKSIPFLRVIKVIINFLILTKFKQFFNEKFLGTFIYFILQQS